MVYYPSVAPRPSYALEHVHLRNILKKSDFLFRANVLRRIKQQFPTIQVCKRRIDFEKPWVKTKMRISSVPSENTREFFQNKLSEFRVISKRMLLSGASEPAGATETADDKAICDIFLVSRSHCLHRGRTRPIGTAGKMESLVQSLCSVNTLKSSQNMIKLCHNFIFQNVDVLCVIYAPLVPSAIDAQYQTEHYPRSSVSLNREQKKIYSCPRHSIKSENKEKVRTKNAQIEYSRPHDQLLDSERTPKNQLECILLIRGDAQGVVLPVELKASFFQKLNLRGFSGSLSICGCPLWVMLSYLKIQLLMKTAGSFAGAMRHCNGRQRLQQTRAQGDPAGSESFSSRTTAAPADRRPGLRPGRGPPRPSRNCSYQDISTDFANAQTMPYIESAIPRIMQVLLPLFSMLFDLSVLHGDKRSTTVTRLSVRVPREPEVVSNNSLTNRTGEDLSTTNRLNEYISHYEEASYSREDVAVAHHRAKRSAPDAARSAPVQISFRAHGRSFRLRLKRDTETFSHRLQVIDSENRPVGHDLSHIYHGHLIGEPGSFVYGSLIDGVFEGKIHSNNNNAYYVERAHRYFPNNRNTSFHSVIYKDEDVEDAYAHRRSNGHVGGCGVTEEVSQWMETVQNSAVEPEPVQTKAFRSSKLPSKENGDGGRNYSGDQRFNSETPYAKYSQEANSQFVDMWLRVSQNFFACEPGFAIFPASAGAFCGNKIVEDGEECDCGYDEIECRDKCCYPRLVSEIDKVRNSSAKGCSRRANTQCSPSQGPCCMSDECRFVPAMLHVRCKPESECSWSSMCDGTSPTCPAPQPKKNKTRCNEGTQLCLNGECRGSICLEWNMTECFLTSQNGANVDKRILCELACQNGTDTSTCRSTSEFAERIGLPPGGISLRPGSPCDNFQGYCDVFLKCRAVDAEGPLARLKNLLFNKETLSSLTQWVTEYWWACLLMGLGFIVFMGVFIKCCAVHTPSSNPKKAPARRFSETLRRPMHTLRRMGPGHASRPNPRRAPAHGYGEGRGHYYHPKVFFDSGNIIFFPLHTSSTSKRYDLPV
ncbi:unnamed protein product [Nesidiocoris tenuis]|uniref:Disintegrin domain-containing protein n=1 Tax=Nesidiocoris tenuis TaxID=355587 RepID=A0A6H5HAN8_9HEMI|nr:unnamed protein product [Nesidiocoris tenuis]